MKVTLSVLVIFTLIGIIWFTGYSNKPIALEKQSANLAPVISLHDILTATDLIEGIKQAILNDDEDAIDSWLDKGLTLAEEAELPAEDIDYLQSDLAKSFVIFQAQRRLFNDAVKQAYYAVEDISPIKAKYPEAKDLFAKVDKLILNRNKIIQKIAEQLADGKPLNDDYLKSAEQSWKQMAKSNQN